MSLSTHVLDTARGVPAAGIEVALIAVAGAKELARGVTSEDGRVAAPFGGLLGPGVYELRFFVRAYFERHQLPTFYDWIPIRFTIHDASQHHHVPLLLSPYGYSTYRGS